MFLVDDAEIERDAFAIGETVFACGHGLPPLRLLTFGLEGKGGNVLARFCTDRHGSLPVTALMPYVGLHYDDTAKHSLTPEESGRDLARDEYVIRIGGEKDAPFEQRIAFRIRAQRAPCIAVTDPSGRLLTGLAERQHEFRLSLRNFPEGCVRVFVVPRQFGWRVGDAIEPARSSDGTPMIRTFRQGNTGSGFLRLGAAELPPGSYQFIARAFPPGSDEADELRLLAQDIVSHRRCASLVIRPGLARRPRFSNGVTLTPQITGRPLPHRPYFHFVDNFPKGTDVYAALDPDALPSGLVGKRAAIYVIRHKSAGDWSSSNALADISGPGMSSNVKIVPIVPGCVNWNTTLVWPNPQVAGKYDIVIDFGNNAADPALFTTDGTLDSPLDMIDGYVRAGFYVTEDPSLPGAYASTIGRHDYALPSVPVPSTDTGPAPTDSLPLTATIRYPAQYAGVDAPCAAGTFPLVVVMHGNSGMENSYLGYNYLLDHLARLGFIAMSIYAPVGVMIETRAQSIHAHHGIMAQNNANPGVFNGHVDLDQIGIAGHSRGAEAVVRAARINASEALGWHIRAGISVAPTDYNHYGAPGIPLLVIYGANDGDVSGAWPDRTCFNIYDEAGRPRSFVFVYGGTHDRFNTEWASIEASTELGWDITASDLPQLISLTDHENVAKGYCAAFFQAHLLGRAEQLEFFSAGLKPSLVSGLALHVSHQEAGARILDDFGQGTPAVNTLGGTVIPSSLPTFAENQLRTLDAHSPHVVAGGNVAWVATAARYVSTIPSSAKDVSAFTTLSFRVSQKYESARNPSGQAQNLYVTLADANGKSRAIRVSTFTDIPYPYVRGYDDLVKSAMKSVRIPLLAYTIANAGADDVDLTNLASVTFEFDATGTGELDIDDIEFSL